ncbi:MAG: DUF2808 domain-containing protein [Synechococcaceae cyanobacterium ELA445]|jgi:hypothetical protein
MGSARTGDHRSTTLRARLAGALLMAAIPLLAVAPPAHALELRGQTYFTSPPWKVDFRNYYPYENEGGAEYYFTIELSGKAGAPLGGLQIQQTRGVDRSFGFDLVQSRAFLGLPRREGAPVPVAVSFDQDKRLFLVTFPQPLPPGTTFTLALRPYRNPSQADTYMFQVTAFPAGPDPVASPVGFATMPIYEPVRF